MKTKRAKKPVVKKSPAKKTTARKTAVVLFNLGGPDSKEAIRPFLMNFFMDKNIIPLPLPLRFFIATLIANRRSKREAADSYGELGDKSPLLKNTNAQARALEKKLGAGFKVFTCMRYWHPMAPQVVAQVQKWGAEEIILLPLYPQFSTTTSWSSLCTWQKAMVQAGYDKPVNMVCCYPRDTGFIKASADNIKKQIAAAKKDGHTNFRILFSAHGLPEDVITSGDPYQWQCEETAKEIVKKLSTVISNESEKSQALKRGDSSSRVPRNDRAIDWAICYQSRVGPKKWIGPALEEEIARAAKDGKAVIIYPHAFTQEHVETLVELDIEYREKAEELGIHGYYRAATVSTHPNFIDGLAALVKARSGKKGVKSDEGKRICPDNFTRCCMRKTC